MKILYSFHARDDLHEIFEYIAYALASPTTAGSLANKIMREIQSLESMPERNPLFQDEPWCGRGVRVLKVKKYLVFYTVDSDTSTVIIERIIYGGRDISRQLEDKTE